MRSRTPTDRDVPGREGACNLSNVLAVLFAADASGGGAGDSLSHSTALSVGFAVVVVLIAAAVALPRFRRFAERRKERKAGPGSTWFGGCV
jgi:hypothetical protein